MEPLRFKVNMWIGTLNEHVIGPLELPESELAGLVTFCTVFFVPDFLEDVSLVTLRSTWFQSNGFPAHYGHKVRH